MNRRAQSGVATVEFAVAGVAAFMLLFGTLEISRAFFVWNTVAEATRRAAQLGAVCAPGSEAVSQAALFATGDAETSPVLPGLTTANVSVSYLDDDGAPTAAIPQISYVRVAIAGYSHTLLIPFLDATLTVPAFSTTLPAESLGYVPGAAERGCFST